jgi:hypothetical protein
MNLVFKAGLLDAYQTTPTGKAIWMNMALGHSHQAPRKMRMFRLNHVAPITQRTAVRKIHIPRARRKYDATRPAIDITIRRISVKPIGVAVFTGDRYAK